MDSWSEDKEVYMIIDLHYWLRGLVEFLFVWVTGPYKVTACSKLMANVIDETEGVSNADMT